MKLAIVVGHNSDSQGAVRTDTRESEFRFNSRIAELIKTYARQYDGLSTQIFFRQSGGGYTREIRRVYAETDAWGADATVELHFNGAKSPQATGTETLTSGTPASMRMAVEVNNAMVAALGLRDRGVKTRREGRGSQSLMVGDAPAILIEPFFGSSASDCKAVGPSGEEALARAVLRGVTKANDLMPRKNLDDSRTIKEVKRQKAYQVAQAVSVPGFAGSESLRTTIEDTRGEVDALAAPPGSAFAEWLPWISFGLAVVAIAATIAQRVSTNRIEGARVDDHKKELR